MIRERTFSTELNPRDLAVISVQLGRPARDVVAVPARCVCGNPVVVSTSPRLSDGTPFPTFYYLTHPVATASVSTLEAEQLMAQFNQQLADDLVLAASYRSAHYRYIQAREAFKVVPELVGISAGGMPGRVKCLHALVAHALAVGPGVNPFGDVTLAQLSWSPQNCVCADFQVTDEYFSAYKDDS